MNDLTKEYIRLVETDRDFCEESFRRQVDYIKNSTAKYHGRVVRTLFIPKIFDSAAAEDLKNIAETMQTILCKVVKEYLDNHDFRKLFLFDSDLERLILTDCGYESFLPVARVDIFYNEDKIRVNISRDDDYKDSKLTFVGYDPNVVLSKDDDPESSLDEQATSEEITVTNVK